MSQGKQGRMRFRKSVRTSSFPHNTLEKQRYSDRIGKSRSSISVITETVIPA